MVVSVHLFYFPKLGFAVETHLLCGCSAKITGRRGQEPEVLLSSCDTCDTWVVIPKGLSRLCTLLRKHRGACRLLSTELLERHSCIGDKDRDLGSTETVW